MSAKEIKIISGDKKDLNISDVQDTISLEKPKKKISKEQKIIIPTEKK